MKCCFISSRLCPPAGMLRYPLSSVYAKTLSSLWKVIRPRVSKDPVKILILPSWALLTTVYQAMSSYKIAQLYKPAPAVSTSSRVSATGSLGWKRNGHKLELWVNVCGGTKHGYVKNRKDCKLKFSSPWSAWKGFAWAEGFLMNLVR